MVNCGDDDPPEKPFVKPDSLIWLITSRCNLRCRTCYVSDRFSHQRELDTREAEKLLQEALALGVEYVGFTGGEALLRPDIFRLMEQSREKKVKTTVVTNGLACTPEVAERLSALGVEVYLSLDGVNPTTHEGIRGKGTWERVRRAAQTLKEKGVTFDMVMALGRHNLEEARKFIPLASSWGARSAIYIPVMLAGRASRDMLLTSQDMARVLLEIEEAAEAHGYPVSLWCVPFAGAVIRSPYVSYYSCRACQELDIIPSGEILLCDVLDFRVGQVKGGLVEAWEAFCQHPLVKALAEAPLPAPCSDCPARGECRGGCFARAYILRGDLFAPDPLCPRAN
ncbi:MAG TPA: radical SAM protein [Moorella mulderi]|nr:radical SAM protein [Moorella mulderi]